MVYLLYFFLTLHFQDVYVCRITLRHELCCTVQMHRNNGTEHPQLYFSVCFLGIYRPRALPSAGLFPFARSFLCDFKSTKTDDPSEILNGLPDLRSSRYNLFIP